MNAVPRSFYITTPIYYVNDKPHIGHVYTTTICDVAARFHRFLGCDVFFLTGTDEHGIKVEKSATDQGVTPQEIADRNAAEFESVMGLLHMTNDDFIRTTQPRHTSQVTTLVARLIDSGDVYPGEYEGWYDEGQEEYVTDTKAAESDYKSPVSGKPLVKAKERNYFFRLSAYQDRLLQHIDACPGFIRPEARKNEVLGRLRDGLQDIPISRTNFTWGIPVPGDESHVIYVWVDALMNYVTAIGLVDADLPESARRGYWPAQFHVIGKEILFFHAIVWPAVLMALGIKLPECVYAHSFWIREGRKMSKSLGNFIDLPTIQSYTDRFGLDAWRWFMATQGPLGATDADFAHSKFVEVYNSELANTLGNAVNRVSNMINRYQDGIVKPAVAPDPADFDWPGRTAAHVADSIDRMHKLDLSGSMHAALSIVRDVNGYIDVTKPFSVAKEPERADELATILYNCIEAIRIASLLLWPALPQKMEAFWQRLGLSIDPQAGSLTELAAWGGLSADHRVTTGDPLFPRWKEPEDE
ncbi:MAG: methionine--tRNA ligase [Planctomycetes bacterium]|nr:methionine--tRNA ligase [Planctomycetota bacterium]NOG54006.1 methionine--tRNA ligase [Planctomycetota bacterium]